MPTYLVATPHGRYAVTGPAGATHHQLAAAVAQHVGQLSIPGLPGTPMERNLTVAGVAVGAGLLGKLVGGSWAWAIGMGIATPLALIVGIAWAMKSNLAANPAAPSGGTPAGGTTTNQSIALKPGAMAPLSTVSSTTAGPGMAPMLSFQPPSASGKIQGYVSSNPNVIANLDPTFASMMGGVGNVSVGAASPGTTTLTFTWSDGGATQTSTIAVTAS